MNSLTLIMEFETSVMKLNDFINTPNPLRASWVDSCWHLIVQHVDLILAHIANPLQVNLKPASDTHEERVDRGLP